MAIRIAKGFPWQKKITVTMSSTQLLFEELTAFCQSDSLSEDGLREIIERHNWTPNREIIERHDAPDNDDPSINDDHAFFLEVCRNKR